MNTSERMRDIVRDAIPEGDFIPSLVAQKVAAMLSENDPTFLDAWLHEHAPYFITHMMTTWMRTSRHVAVSRAQRGVFEKAAEKLVAGEVLEEGIFEQLYVVAEDKLRRKLGDMTGTDHVFVATRYQNSAQRDGLLAEFHRAVARKVKKRKTSEVMSEEQYEALLRSVLAPHHGEEVA